MAVLIFLIIIDLIMIGVVMYFVVNEKTEHRDHYVPDHADAADTSASASTPAPSQSRDWAVQTTSDAEADTPTSAQEVVDTVEEAAQEPDEIDPIHEESLPDDAEPVTLSEAAEQAVEEPEAPLNEADPEGKDKA